MAAMETLPPPPPKHHIFLSHSGQQKGFAADLKNRLSSLSYSVFFDQDHHSLPPGQPFPHLIFSAANTCKIAIVVLSHDFLCSPWPMIELCAFAGRLPSQSDSSSDVAAAAAAFTLLPLFFKLSPKDFKDNENLERWRKAWEGFERNDDRIKASDCERAVTKLLRPRNGVRRLHESVQGEESYIDEVLKSIFIIMPPPGGFTIPNKKYAGKFRLYNVIRDKFKELEDARSPSVDVCILGMHGVPGSGKTTLCQFLCESMFDELSGNVVYLMLPTELATPADKLSSMKEQCAKLLSTFNPYVKDAGVMDLNRMLHMLNHAGPIRKMALVVLDNISALNRESYRLIIEALLSSGVLAPGSKILLVAQSPTILDGLRPLIEDERWSSTKYSFDIMQVPCMTEAEAIEVMTYQLCPSMKDELTAFLHRKIGFLASSSMYIPFIFEQIGVLLGEQHSGDLEELWKMLDECKRNAVQKLVETNFKRLPEDLKLLFLDIALFFIPAEYSHLDVSTPILRRMHGITDDFTLKWKIKDLQKYCTLSIMDNHLRVHDIFTEYARSIHRNYAPYVYLPSLDITSSMVSSHSTSSQICTRATYGRKVHLTVNCLEARAIYIGLCTGSTDQDHDDAERCSCDDQEVRLHVDIGTKAQTLFVRNRCRYTKCILSLSGDLLPLACFRMENVHQIALSSRGNGANFSKLLRLELRNANVVAQDSQMKTYSGQKRKRTRSSSWDFMSQSWRFMRWLLEPGMFSGELVHNFISSGRMRGLRVLILHEVTGIPRLEIGGEKCPELEILEVWMGEKEQMDVIIEKAPMLKSLYTGLQRYYFASFPRSCKERPRKKRELALQITKCPELQEIYVAGWFDQVKFDGLLPSKSRHLSLANNGGCREFLPWKWVSSSARHDQLSALQELCLQCTKVERMHFTRQHLGCCLPSLRELILEDCTGLRHVSVDPRCVPSLVRLDVHRCDVLEVLEGVEDVTLMVKMQFLCLSDLPELRWEFDVMMRSSLGSSCKASSCSLELQRIHAWDCPHVRIPWTVLEASKKLLDISGSLGGCMGKSKISVEVPGPFTFLEGLFLTNVHDLREIEGIEHMRNLWHLEMWDMPNLTRVTGRWPSSIRAIGFRKCPMLLEVPCLEQTPNLRDLTFYKCKSLNVVEVCFHESQRLERVEIVKCESMDAFPMEEGHPVMIEAKRKDGEVWVSVYGSKFARVETMQEWLQDAEYGSPLWMAAVEALMWELLEKGTLGVLDALHEALHGYFNIAKEKLLPLTTDVIRPFLYRDNRFWFHGETTLSNLHNFIRSQ